MENKANDKGLVFDKYELEIIRELLSQIACAYEREDFFYHCCDANEIIEKIDSHLKKGVEQNE